MYISKLFLYNLLLFSVYHNYSILAQGYGKNTFGYDLELVKTSENNSIVLTKNQAQILVSPKYQGRVLTSTSKGIKGRSYGWLNENTLRSNAITTAKKSYGGEDRFWLNPLGSSFTLYYDQKEIKSNNWTIPKLLEIEAFDLINKTDTTATFNKQAVIKNNIGTSFMIKIERYVSLFSKSTIQEQLKIKIPKSISYVGFGSKNSITNIGENWDASKGLIAPWVLGMFKGNKKSVGIFPYTSDNDSTVTVQKYLSEFGNDRVSINNKVIYFKTDGSYRSKIGVKSKNVIPILGNFDAKNNVLTIVTFSFNPKGKFLSSTEKNSPILFGGDVINSYNNDGNQGVSTFFELETTASGKALKTGEQIIHIHNTYHFEGPIHKLNRISKKLLHCDLEEALLFLK